MSVYARYLTKYFSTFCGIARPYLAANVGFFELRTFPWSPGEIEVYVHSLVWSQRLTLEVVTCKFVLLKRPITLRKGVVGRGISMMYTYFGRILLLWSNLMHSHYFFSVIMRLVEFFHFRCVCRIYFFLNHLTPPSKDKLMPRAPKVKKGFEEILSLA